MARTYTTERIVELIRRKMEDEVLPYIVADDFVYQAIDEAQNEFVERTHCITDATTFAPTVTEDDPWVAISDRILQIRRATLTTDGGAVQPITLAEMEMNPSRGLDYGVQNISAWRTATGTPKYVITDLDDENGRLVPIPVEDDTLTLEVYAYPKVIEDDAQDPMIPDRWAAYLVNGALTRLLLVEDHEVYDRDAGRLQAALWENAIARAVGYFERNRRGPGTVQFSTNGVW